MSDCPKCEILEARCRVLEADRDRETRCHWRMAERVTELEAALRHVRSLFLSELQCDLPDELSAIDAALAGKGDSDVES